MKIFQDFEGFGFGVSDKIKNLQTLGIFIISVLNDFSTFKSLSQFLFRRLPLLSNYEVKGNF